MRVVSGKIKIILKKIPPNIGIFIKKWKMSSCFLEIKSKKVIKMENIFWLAPLLCVSPWTVMKTLKGQWLMNNIWWTNIIFILRSGRNQRMLLTNIKTRMPQVQGRVLYIIIAVVGPLKEPNRLKYLNNINFLHV